MGPGKLTWFSWDNCGNLQSPLQSCYVLALKEHASWSCPVLQIQVCLSVTAKPIFAFTQSLNCLCGLYWFCLPKQRSPYTNCLSILEPSIRISRPGHRSWAFRIRLVIQSSQQMLSIDLRLGKWNCPTIARLLYKVHVSHPYKRLVRTMVLSFVGCLMLCWVTARVLKWLRAWPMLPILALTSLSSILSLPGYLKSSTIFSFHGDGGGVKNGRTERIYQLIN